MLALPLFVGDVESTCAVLLPLDLLVPNPPAPVLRSLAATSAPTTYAIISLLLAEPVVLSTTQKNCLEMTFVVAASPQLLVVVGVLPSHTYICMTSLL